MNHSINNKYPYNTNFFARAAVVVIVDPAYAKIF